MSSREAREKFLQFFTDKEHKVVSSAPIVVKDDPTLMFTNAGMNQFKDFFLGNKKPSHTRIADTQKCLRVSGKHNDLEEVGKDTYHHTMFEMLGNWSFGDYFKEEAIDWAWELLTKVYGIDAGKLYITIFEGDEVDGVDADEEAFGFWKKHIAEERILRFGKKDNFWEMGNVGPCGPCSEIHIDLRNEDEKEKQDGKELVNADHPQVVEIWNLVFIQYNRQADGNLVSLPQKHVDTGMGFERLCMVLQGKQSNYDTDVFTPLIDKIAGLCGKKYGAAEETDIAMRVIADHLRAVTFTIADGQLPSNTGAGYVIRRILRRAVRYGYSFLGFEEAFMYTLLPVLAQQMGDVFPEIVSQQALVEKVIKEEEESFLRTLKTGLKRIEDIIDSGDFDENGVVDGAVVFELYDTFGFPVDLTRLILEEKNLQVDEAGFSTELQKQKQRSKADASMEQGDWTILIEDNEEEFVGYDQLQTEVKLTKYRKVVVKGKDQYHLVFNMTPFYAESGGQVGDTGYIETKGEKTYIKDTKKENNLIIHYTDKLPSDPSATFEAVVNKEKRELTANNHSATHLLHQALREVLGDHVEQKGSLVNPDYLRFDFSHFSKMTDEEVQQVEKLVNERIREDLSLEEKRDTPIKEALDMGAMALFGEKYGDVVRVIKFGESVELCGGTHVPATGKIGLFKITSEGAIAAGVRRIEAISGPKSYEYVNERLAQLEEVKEIAKNPSDPVKGVRSLAEENQALKKELEKLSNLQANQIKENLKQKVVSLNGIQFIGEVIEPLSSEAVKNLVYNLKNEVSDVFAVVGTETDGKALLTIIMDDKWVKEKNLNAGQIIREVAKEIQGGGGGQPFYATAGGKNPAGLQSAIDKTKVIVENS